MKQLLHSRKTHRNLFLILSIGVPFVLFCLLVLYPTISIFQSSFYKWSGITLKKTFIGWKNFQDVFSNYKFFLALKNTFFLMVVASLGTMGLSMFYAICIVQSKMKERAFYRVVLFFPNMLSAVIVSIIFRYVFDPNSGILNGFLALFGVDGPVWLGDVNVVMWAIAIPMVWSAVGYYMLIYIAALDNISPSLYESADIDGANVFLKFFKITIPMMWEVLRVTFVLYILSALNGSFMFVRVLTNSGPNGRSEVIMNYMFRQAFRNGNFGYGMTVAVVIFFITFGLALLSNWLTGKKNQF